MGYGRYSMVTVRIGDWSEFYKLASSFLDEKETWVFRGHTKVDWELAPTLERVYKEYMKDEKDGWEKKTTIEIAAKKHKTSTIHRRQFDSFAEFLSWYLSSSTHANESEQIETFKAATQWEHYMGEHKLPYLAAMQHYGFPTRLLDFTYSLFVAAHFAFDDKRFRGDRAIWAIRLDPIWENVKYMLDVSEEASIWEAQERVHVMADELIGDTGSKYKYGILPVLTGGNNPRLKAQNGLFLMPFTIDGFFKNLERSFPGGLAQLSIPATDELHIGVSEFSLNDYLQLGNKQNIVVMKIICSKEMMKRADSVFQQMNLTTERLFPDQTFADVRGKVKYRFWHK